MVFLSTLLATWLIVSVLLLGRRHHQMELKTGTLPKGTDALIFGSCGFVLAALYFADAHPLIGNTLAIIVGLGVGYGYLLFAGLLVRLLRAARQR